MELNVARRENGARKCDNEVVLQLDARVRRARRMDSPYREENCLVSDATPPWTSFTVFKNRLSTPYKALTTPAFWIPPLLASDSLVCVVVQALLLKRYCVVKDSELLTIIENIESWRKKSGIQYAYVIRIDLLDRDRIRLKFIEWSWYVVDGQNFSTTGRLSDLEVTLNASGPVTEYQISMQATTGQGRQAANHTILIFAWFDWFNHQRSTFNHHAQCRGLLDRPSPTHKRRNWRSHVDVEVGML